MMERAQNVALALLLALLVGLSVGVPVGMWLVERDRPVVACQEDDPCWRCAEMGNRVCGLPSEAPRRAVAALAAARVAPVAPDHSWVVSGLSDGWPGRKCIHIRTKYRLCMVPVEGGDKTWR